ncbi:TetR/AcrR family transcriptional regulator [Kitasatospora aureofaciens]|uniref:TetR/AcrR family transcriptional regulator n=1 Tax=Kitasatospora aureofaciens TaxID=1894 RepID=UPI001C43965B|nr:TetR family transcriptional regulator [Kitasatospora aureofaciens]MBV6700460.1 TetR/AcrR family transcriptional regulator C-terminal ligand-binding domain-containing protein [Kitasatospora aureofaciens]
MAGRPRGVDDAVLLRHTAEVMGQVGPGGFTLAAVARAAGVVPATLVQRFGSKRGLLLALARGSAEAADGRYERLRASYASPLAALRALAEETSAPMATPESFANHLAFLCMDLADPELHEHALSVHRAQGRAIARLLDAALEQGELRADADPARLARSVQAVIAGTGLTWALDREGDLPQRLREELADLLSPHVTTKTEES